MQLEVPNHLKVLLSKVMVLSVKETLSQRTWQVSIGEMNESKPLMTPRKAQLLSKPWGYATMGQVQRETAYCLDGNRGKGGMNLIQAQIRNMRTSMTMVTEKSQVKNLRGRNTEV
jgi:hypothetical protein